MKFLVNGNIIFLWLLFSFASTVKAQESTHLIKSDPNAQFTQATNLLFQGLLDESISSFVHAGNEYRKSKNEHQLIGCYLGIATCYSLKGNFRKSLKFNEMALSIHKRNGENDQEGLNLILSNIVLCKEARKTAKSR